MAWDLSHAMRISVRSETKNVTSHAKFGTRLSTFSSLRPYLDKAQYTVREREPPYAVVRPDMRLTRIMSVAVTRLPRAVIELEPTNSSAVNESDIIRSISDITGIDSNDIIVEVVQNEDGETTIIYVFVRDEDTAQAVAAAMDSLEKGDACSAGVLFRRTRVSADGEPLSFSGAPSIISKRGCLLTTLLVVVISVLI